MRGTVGSRHVSCGCFVSMWPRKRLAIATAMAGVLVVGAVTWWLASRNIDDATVPEALASSTQVDPIPWEALVFRSAPGAFALEPMSPRRVTAHPRSLSTYRALRAFPGAPPRVPHGLTIEEIRAMGCRTCHDRGGYSPRFGAYTPVTPHPEQGSCLQCHLMDEHLVGTPLPTAGETETCRQCHDLNRLSISQPRSNWQPAVWPRVGIRTIDSAPPAVPHDLQTRGNCLACHMGPHAVAEIRVSHPERANCRQCHLALVTSESVYMRTPPSDGQASSAGGNE